MSRTSYARTVLLGAVLAGCATLPAPGDDSARPYVVMVSIDGFRHDYLDRYHPAAFEALASRGVRARSLVPSFPSKTFPNHHTLVTGLRPGHHGIVGNTFFDPARDAWYRLADTLAVRDGSWYGGEPIWVTAARNGVRSGAYFWPGSEAQIAGARPSMFARYDARTPNDRRVDESVGWLRLPPAQRPHLLLMYLSDVDDTTHRHGPDAPQTALAVASVDRAVRRLLDSLAVLPIRDSVNVVLVSDHGMTAVSAARSIAILDRLAQAGVDTAGIRASDNGPVMSLWFGGDTARIAAAYHLLARSLGDADVYRRDAIPERMHLAGNPRAGDLLLVARPGWMLRRRGTDRPAEGGAHGHEPSFRDMHGIFIAAGPNVRRVGVVPSFDNVEVYGFLAALLKLERVPKTDGTGAALNYVK